MLLQLNQSPEEFLICRGYGCWRISKVHLSAEEWKLVQAPLTQKADTPEEERQHIAKAIAAMERVVGGKTGTDIDAGGATVLGHGPYQMDCIDEAVNTSLYLKFFEREELLKWHEVGDPARRGHLIDGTWPHNTAVVSENETSDMYAIDSWFFANGEEPSIVPLQDWHDGWRPADFEGNGTEGEVE
jgi:hypothetical protein